MNRNTLWANIFVDELARNGLKAVCAAPGSRHTPLMLAFAKHPDIKVYSHLDERSAAFFALGLAMATDSPVATVCTSGTAGANMFPAIIEAHQSRVPLIVITADRPHELRESGANQTIDQVKMFGDFVLWAVDTALPEANPPAIAIRNLRTLAARVYAKTNGLRKGVVHVNMPFRKPLEPTPVDGDMVEVPEGAFSSSMGTPQTFMWQTSTPTVSPQQLERLVSQIARHAKGIIVMGLGLPRHTIFGALRLSRKLKFPVFADPISNNRFVSDSSLVFAAYESYFQQMAENPTLVIRVGDVPISKWLNTYISKNSRKTYIHISESGEWSDDSHTVSDFYHAQVTDTLLKIERASDKREATQWYDDFAAMETTSWQTIDHQIETGEYFDGAVVYDVVELIPDESILFAGNSLPVRHLDQFGKPQNKRIYAYANRGASGIDGNISTALGLGAANPDKPLVAIMGDITFYHDMNGLLAAHRSGVPITIVLLNNDGGGIFNRLPIKNHDPEFTEYFITAHGLDFSHAAKLYGLDYVSIDAYASGARQQFREVFAARVGGDTSTIIEVRTDGKRDDARRQAIVKAVHDAIEQLDLGSSSQ